MSELPKQNARQRRRFFEVDGETLCLKDWARRSGIGEMAIRSRLAKGLTMKEAISQPVDPRRSEGARRAMAARWAGHEKTKKAKTPTMIAWSGMIGRCLDPNHDSYEHYKARGITVCERWMTFANFLEDMGERPLGMELDRTNNDDGYYKENCRWATRKQQCRNMSTNHFITHNGMTKCIAEWAEYAGIKADVLHSRIKRGWEFERALTSPLVIRRKKNG